MTTPSARIYGGWQRDRSSFLFGLTPARAAMLAAALLLVMAPVFARSLHVALVTLPLALLLVGLALLRISGRTASEWIGDVSRFNLAKQRGQTRFLSAAAAPVDRDDPAGAAPMDLPGTLAPLRFITAEDGAGSQVAVVHNPLENTYTLVGRIRPGGLSLTETNRQEARVASWGALLASLCSDASPFIRVQACVRTLPGDSTALRRWHEAHTVPGAPAAAVANAEQLLAGSAPISAQHNAWLSFTMSAAKARTDIRGAGDGDAAACAVLLRRARGLAEALRQASLTVEAWLDVRDLAEVIRTGFEPTSVAGLADRRIAARAAQARGEQGGLPAGVAPELAGPAAAESLWASYRHDDATSVTYLVYDWPKTNVYAAFLAPLLAHNGSTSARRAFSLHLQPLPPRVAARRLLAEATKAETANAMKRKTGKLQTAADTQQRRQIDAQDVETAAGHGLVRFMGYLTVTVTDPAQLDRAVADVEADAAAARIELRRMYAQQDVGFFASVLPLGTGIPMPRFSA